MNNIRRICPNCAGIPITLKNVGNPQWWFCSRHSDITPYLAAPGDHGGRMGLDDALVVATARQPIMTSGSCAMTRNKYLAKKSDCAAGHSHPSAKEARRCNDLHLLQRAGHIEMLTVQPVFHFAINGRLLKHPNGSIARYTADFSYFEKGKNIVEDVKGFTVRDWPLRRSLFIHCYPDTELRII